MIFIIEQASEKHLHYAEAICNEMEASAKVRGTGIAKRTPEYLQKKMIQKNAIIALTETGNWAGFCYIETWSHEKFVANSGLIVSPEYREFGIAKKIKQAVFKLSRNKYPNSKIFGLTTGLAVMKINSDLGYEPVIYSELTQDEDFWKGCMSCINHEILISKERKNCICTAMIWDPVQKEKDKKVKIEQKIIAKERLTRMKKKYSLLKIISLKFKKKK